MPFIPHTESDVQKMLAAIGVENIAALFDEIPSNLHARPLTNIPDALNEMQLGRVMQRRAAQDVLPLCFAGAGAYEHHIPAAVWDVATRGEFMTAYTPYQAEASQGTLQLLYEYQTMMVNLTGMEVSNASLYDGATALAEAILMAVRVRKPSETARVLLPATLHPAYRETVRTLVQQDIELIEVPMNDAGNIDLAALQQYANITALVIPQPNFFGLLEDMDTLTEWAQEGQQALVIAVVNPLSLALLKEPGRWGQQGADIVCGELQPFGMPLASGGPYAGFLCCKQTYVRQMPGRIIGATVDKAGKRGFTLTLQAREQHIRRGKATSNICTNQGLLVTAATIYMSLLGFEGLRRVAAQCHASTRVLLNLLTKIPGIEQVFDRPFFHEIVVRLPVPVNTALDKLAAQGILGGYALEQHYPTLKNCLLICATETKTPEDLALFAEKLTACLF